MQLAGPDDWGCWRSMGSCDRGRRDGRCANSARRTYSHGNSMFGSTPLASMAGIAYRGQTRHREKGGAVRGKFWKVVQAVLLESFLRSSARRIKSFLSEPSRLSTIKYVAISFPVLSLAAEATTADCLRVHPTVPEPHYVAPANHCELCPTQYLDRYWNSREPRNFAFRTTRPMGQPG
jgi:hypothetical protein